MYSSDTLAPMKRLTFPGLETETYNSWWRETQRYYVDSIHLYEFRLENPSHLLASSNLGISEPKPELK